MADWRNEIKTAQQKTDYIRNVLDIQAPKSSKEYRSAYQRLRFYSEGKTNAPKAGSKYEPVKIKAEATAKAKEKKNPERPEPAPKGEPIKARGRFRIGDYITADVNFVMRSGGKTRYDESRSISETITLSSKRTVDLANKGEIGRAVIAEYFGGAGSDGGTGGGGGAESYADEIEVDYIDYEGYNGDDSL